jgi:hypothetical protein
MVPGSFFLLLFLTEGGAWRRAIFGALLLAFDALAFVCGAILLISGPGFASWLRKSGWL